MANSFRSAKMARAPSCRATTHSVLKTLTLASLLSATAIFSAQAEENSALAAATISKISNMQHMSSLLANSAPDARHRVIVQYRVPTVSAPAGATAEEADALLMATNAQARDAIIADVFGSVASVASGAMADKYNMKGMDYTPNVVMELTTAEIDKIAANSNVEIVEADYAYAPSMDQSTVFVSAPQVWTAGGRGSGRVVVVMDTGSKKSHEFLANAVVSEACYNSNVPAQNATSRCPGGVEASTASGSGADCPESFASGCSHGTHVAGTVLGYNNSRQAGEPLRGMAYQADLIPINVFSRFTGSICRGGGACVLAYTSDQIAAMNRVYALRNTYKIDAVNMSLGGGQFFNNCDTNSFKPSVDLLRGVNIATIIAAGNDGFDTSVGAPGCISTAVTVASSLDNSNTRSSFSNWGSLIDLVAPGSNIQSSVYGSSASTNTTYSNYNGTSMATPHVAGAWSMLRQLYPTATVTQIENALKSTGVSVTSAGTTKPRIHMYNACRSLGGGTCGATSSAGPIFASILPTARGTRSGRFITAFANITNAGSSTATSCRITSPDSGSTFEYRASNSTNTSFILPSNTPVNVAAGATQNFVIGFLPSSTTNGRNVNLTFDCSNTSAAGRVNGLNTFVYGSAGSTSTYVDMLAISATIGNTGYINIPGNSGTSFASVAAVNIGNVNTSVRVSITEQALGGTDPNMRANLAICIANSSAICQTGYSSSHLFTANLNQPVYVIVRATGTGNVANNPALNRAHIYFRRASNNAYAGATSVAVRTVAGPAPALTAAVTAK